MDEQVPAGKPFEIPKQEVWDAWLKVKANGGAPGADGQSIEDFEADLKNNLYKVWNRMSSVNYAKLRYCTSSRPVSGILRGLATRRAKITSNGPSRR